MLRIKIIDLLNKIANNEELPKKIKWQGQIYEYSNFNRFYYQNNWSMYRDFYTEGNCLNDEVEILDEEPKKIEKWGEGALEEMEKCTDYTLEDLQKYIRILAETQNELIDEINNLKEKKDE